MRSTSILILLTLLAVPGTGHARDEATLLDLLEGRSEFSTLVAALEFTGLDAAVDDPTAALTVFAPTNRAFERTLAPLGLSPADLLTEANRDLTEQVLLYHVLGSEALRRDVLRLDGASVETLQGDAIEIDILFRWFIRLNGDTFVIQADRRAANGVAHVISRVLLPPSLFAEPTLFDRLRGNSRFSTLVAALEFTGLDVVLDDPMESVTLLAPDDHAFARTLGRLGLTAGDLLTEENRELTTEILLYHVIGGEVPGSAVRAASGQSVPTLQGESLRVDVLFRFLIVLDRRVVVVRTDVDASNGIAHDISGVLLPPSLGLH